MGYTRKDIEHVVLGTFESISNTLRVSDPCYGRGTGCAGQVQNTKVGKWLASIVRSDEDGWGIRVAELHAVHEDYANPMVRSTEILKAISGDFSEASKVEIPDWEEVDFVVGVDSGQAGIYDEEQFQGDNGGWYNKCCETTLSFPGAGCIQGGVVSSSGYGDGGYSAFTLKNIAGEVIGVKVIFIEAEESDEEDNVFDEDTVEY